MEFRLLSGNTNRLFDILEKHLVNIESDLSAEAWNLKLEFQRPKLHGGQFKGGQYTSLLGATEVLWELIESAGLQEDVYLKNIIKAFECLKHVKDSCFGNHLSHDFVEKIVL